MDNNEFWQNLWRGVFVTLVALTITVASCNVSNTAKINDTVARMITEGKTPKEASCAVAIANGSTENTRVYCLSTN